MASKSLNTVLQQVRGIVDPGSLGEASDGQLLERFTDRGEEAAFAALLRRHGPMVLGVSRRLLHQAQDAEDVFQATFLLLARKAGTIRKQDSVGGWLHQVAVRLALRLRAQRTRRQDHERRVATMRKCEAEVEGAWRELQGVLDETLQQLPAKYRSALVLCYLEGRTHEEARRQLGCPLATLRSWVARGRNLLRTRLARRGLALSAEALGAALLVNTARGALPAALVQPTVKAAVRFAPGGPAAATVAAPVARLVEGGLRILGPGKFNIGLALLAVLGLAAGAGVLTQRALRAQAHEGKSLPKPENAGPPRQEEVVRTDRHGDPLPAGAVARLGTVRLRHGSTVTGLAFAPGGQVLISGSYDKTVRLWDPATGRELRRLPPLRGSVMDLAASRDGKTLAVVDMGDLYLVDVPAGRLTRVNYLAGDLPSCVALSPDGKTLAAGCWNFKARAFTVRMWEAASGKLLHEFSGYQAKVRRVVFSPDGKTLVTGAENNSIRTWNVATGREEVRLEVGHSVLSLAYAPDGRTLAAGLGDGQVHLWRMPAGKPLRVLKPGSLGVETVAFSPDGKTLAAGMPGLLTLWEPATGKELRKIWCSAETLAFSPDRRTLGSGGHDCTIRLWDVATGKERHPGAAGTPCSIRSVAATADGTVTATSGQDRFIRLWQTATGKPLARWKALSPWVSTMALSPDGKVLAWDRGLLDRATGKELGHFPDQDYEIKALAFAPDGRTLAMATTDVNSAPGRTIRLWDVARLRERTHFGELPVQSLGYSPDGKTLAAGNRDGTLSLWAVATGQELRRIAGHKREVEAVAFSPDGTLLASCSFDGDIFLWDPATGKQARPLLKNTGGRPAGVNIISLAFSPNGKVLASAEQPFTSPDGASITLWEVATGRVRRRLIGHQGDVNSLVFAGNSRTLVSGSTDTTALVWDVATPFNPGPARTAELSRQKREALWADLRDADAARAYRAVCTLMHWPGAVKFLGRHLSPVPRAEEGNLNALLKTLDSPRFLERKRAGRELEKLGPAAEPALRRALKGQPSVEVAARLRRLLERLAPEELRTRRAVEALELMRSPEARRLLESLAGGAPEGLLTREAKAALRRWPNRP